MAIFKHIFELLWGLPNCTHNWVCHSVTSSQISDYHTPIWRGYPGLSYEPKCLKISFQIRELELGETYMWEIPRNRIALYNMYLTIVLNKDKSLSTWESPHMSYKAVKTAKICSRIAPVPFFPLFAAELRGSETECFKSLNWRATRSLFRSLQCAPSLPPSRKTIHPSIHPFLRLSVRPSVQLRPTFRKEGGGLKKLFLCKKFAAKQKYPRLTFSCDSLAV